MLVDIYVELPARTAAEVERFLNQLLPERRPAQDDFEVATGDGDEAQILEDEKAVLACLESQEGAHCAIYWTNPKQEEAITSAHAFYTLDGGLIGGISVNLGSEKLWCLKVMSLYPGKPCLMLLETPPPPTLAEFRLASTANGQTSVQRGALRSYLNSLVQPGRPNSLRSCSNLIRVKRPFTTSSAFL